MTRVILVTGGLGYLGGRISAGLRQMGFNVFCGTRRERIERPAWAPDLHVRHLNWGSHESLVSACKGVDCIVHLASVNEIRSERDPINCLQENVNNIIRILDAAIASDVKRFIYFSTAHVYGNPLVGRIDEKTLPFPRHPYAISHRMAEDFVLAAHSRRQIDGIVIRLSNGFGYPLTNEIDRWTLLVNDLCRQLAEKNQMRLKGSGQQVRDFITITDIIRAVRHIIDRKDFSNEDGLFNLGGNTTLSVMEMAERIRERWGLLTGKFPKIITMGEYAQCETTLDYRTDKILATGFEPIGNFEEELDGTLRFCRNSFTSQ